MFFALAAQGATKRKPVPSKSAHTKAVAAKSVPARRAPVRRQTSSEEIQRAGEIAAANADRMQSERMDPTVKAESPKTEDSVHAWIRQHHAPTNGAPASKPAAKKTPAVSAKSKAPRKATAADFDAAADAQSKAPEPQPEPATKPRSALTGISMPEEEGVTNDVEVSKTESVTKADPVTKAEAAVVARSPTQKLDLPAPPAAKKPASVAATVVANTRGRKAVIDPQTAASLTTKEFGKKALPKEDADDQDAADSDANDASVSYGPKTMPALLRRNGRLIVPAPMKGSHEILVHQNVMATQDGLDRIEDDDQLNSMRKAKLLAALPVGFGVQVDERLPANRRYARPWTVRFLSDLGRAHFARFHESIQVNSAVRTVDFQRQLMRVNGNAAPPTGDTASPHLTGQAIDLAKHGMSMTEIAWMRGYLLPLVQQGKIDVEEEFQQACFHISVYRRYMPMAAPRREIPIKRSRSTGRLIASSIR
ncbi:DUF5715 family protein [Terriglobus saanensis]|uniref:DUF5715 family protein n=1 Tax=Terriglobus saanensis TaxID=870903 RepID=UPI0011871C80|nr:DUF5715 family protein [Terriglobus saanensis]